MGTFNDPNQFAFFIFTMMLVLLWGIGGKRFIRRKHVSASGECFCWGVFLIGKANQRGCLSVCLYSFVCLSDSFSGTDAAIQSGKAVVDRRRGFCGAVGCWGI